MPFLILTSLIWSLSFGLIKTSLTGLDPNLVAAIRLAISAAVFAPFLRRLPAGLPLRLVGIGAVQFGLMYVLVIRSYQSLAAWQVALFTILTPLHVVLLESLRSRRWRGIEFGGALVAILAAGWVAWPEPGSDLRAPVVGACLVQLSNLAFAFGQLAYKRTVPEETSNTAAMAWAYLGAVGVAGLAAATTAGLEDLALETQQMWVLLYLGVVPSGLGFFFWNKGARRVAVGTLAVMNNLKVPLAVAVSLVVFGESADPARLAPGAALVLLALWMVRRREEAPSRDA